MILSSAVATDPIDVTEVFGASPCDTCGELRCEGCEVCNQGARNEVFPVMRSWNIILSSESMASKSPKFSKLAILRFPKWNWAQDSLSVLRLPAVDEEGFETLLTNNEDQWGVFHVVVKQGIFHCPRPDGILLTWGFVLLLADSEESCDELRVVKWMWAKTWPVVFFWNMVIFVDNSMIRSCCNTSRQRSLKPTQFLGLHGVR